MTETPNPGCVATRPYLTTRQAAFRLCLSSRKLEAMRAAHTGPRFRRHGRLVFYHIDDLEIWSRATADRSDEQGRD